MPDAPDLLALERALLALIAEHAAAPVPDGDPAEVAVKLRRLAAHETMDGRRAWTCKWSAELMRTALAALDQMGTMAGG